MNYDFIPRNKVFPIKVSTKSSQNRIYLEGDIIKVKINEIPENGKANKAIIKLFSKELKIPQNSINIVSGLTSSIKNIIIKD